MDEQERKYRQMTEPPVPGLICKLAVPCIISMLVTSFYNMADTFFVGMLDSTAATGAVGVVFSMMAIIQAVGFFFGHGSGNYIARELGKKNYRFLHFPGGRTAHLHSGSNLAGRAGLPPWLY